MDCGGVQYGCRSRRCANTDRRPSELTQADDFGAQRCNLPSFRTFNAGGESSASSAVGRTITNLGPIMNGLIYLIGLIVVILAILSFFGLR
jgi:hypothetical protein